MTRTTGTTLFATIVAIVGMLACGKIEAGAQPSPTTRVVRVLDCSDEGAEATIRFNGSDVAAWSFGLGASYYQTDVQVIPRGASTMMVHVRKRYNDESEITYQLEVRSQNDSWVPASQVATDYGQTIRQDLTGIAAFYEDTVAAARAGRTEFTCTAGNR